jgi:hypothetical protein
MDLFSRPAASCCYFSFFLKTHPAAPLYMEGLTKQQLSGPPGRELGAAGATQWASSHCIFIENIIQYHNENGKTCPNLYDTYAWTTYVCSYDAGRSCIARHDASAICPRSCNSRVPAPSRNEERMAWAARQAAGPGTDKGQARPGLPSPVRWPPKQSIPERITRLEMSVSISKGRKRARVRFSSPNAVFHALPATPPRWSGGGQIFLTFISKKKLWLFSSNLLQEGTSAKFCIRDNFLPRLSL